MGFSVSRHYCMGIMVEENFYLITDKCDMDTDDHCPAPKQHLQNNCCEDEIISLPGINIVKKSSNDARENPLVPDWRLFLLTTIIFKAPLLGYKVSIPIPSPPFTFTERNILIEIQHFLI